MAEDRFVIGVDVGTQSAKVMIFAANGGVVAAELKVAARRQADWARGWRARGVLSHGPGGRAAGRAQTH